MKKISLSAVKHGGCNVMFLVLFRVLKWQGLLSLMDHEFYSLPEDTEGKLTSIRSWPELYNGTLLQSTPTNPPLKNLLKKILQLKSR